MTSEVHIIKVGGSLYDLPDLGSRLSAWLRDHDAPRVVLVPGGAAAAEVIRAYDRTHQLGEEACHWLALRMLHVNAHFLAQMLPQARIVASPHGDLSLGILDPFAFAKQDEACTDGLPHNWNVTSDSIAVRAATVAAARELVLLKSVAWEGSDWAAAARAGVLDAHFPQALRHAPGLRVRIVNLRSWRPPLQVS
jgi:5-(aminomethyl)-3-furanmethanol phosphate kinase